jgi:hypothetical protein
MLPLSVRESTQRHVPEESNVPNQSCEEFSCHIIQFLLPKSQSLTQSVGQYIDQSDSQLVVQ